MKPMFAVIVMVITTQSLFFVGCVGYPETPMVKWPGPDDPADIVIFFKKDTTNDQINHFLNYEIGRPDPEGRGFDSMEGIRGFSEVYRQGYVGYSLELRTNITGEQRKKILEVIHNSPVVFRIDEDTVPNKVILDPNYKEPDQAPNTNGNRPLKKRRSASSPSY
jgi:hypothetical protein